MSKDNPMKFFERDPLVPSLGDKLDKIADPALREKAETKIRSWAFALERLVDRIVARHNRWERILDNMKPDSPLRAVGGEAYEAAQTRDVRKIGRVGTRYILKKDRAIQRAEKLSERFKAKQRLQSVKSLQDRER